MSLPSSATSRGTPAAVASSSSTVAPPRGDATVLLEETVHVASGETRAIREQIAEMEDAVHGAAAPLFAKGDADERSLLESARDGSLALAGIAKIRGLIARIKKNTRDLDRALKAGKEVTLPDGVRYKLPDHIREAYASDQLCGTTPQEEPGLLGKRPVFLATLARFLGVTYFDQLWPEDRRGDAAPDFEKTEHPGPGLDKNAFLLGFPDTGAIPFTGGWPEGRPMTEQEFSDWLLLTKGVVPPVRKTFRGNDPSSPLRKDLSRPPPGDADILREGWLEIQKLVGVTMERVPEGWDAIAPEDAVTFLMTVPQRWSEEEQRFLKYRTIADDRWRNLFSRPSESPGLPSTQRLARDVDFCLNGGKIPPHDQAKSEVKQQIEWERVRSAADVPIITRPTAPEPKHESWLPAAGKVDASLAFFQLPLRFPAFVAAWNPDENDWVVFRHTSCQMGNIWSVWSWCSCGLLVKKLLEFGSIWSKVYIDDIILLGDVQSIQELTRGVFEIVLDLGIACSPKKRECHTPDDSLVDRGGVLSKDPLQVLGVEWIRNSMTSTMSLQVPREKKLAAASLAKETAAKVRRPGKTGSNAPCLKAMQKCMGCANFVLGSSGLRHPLPLLSVLYCALGALDEVLEYVGPRLAVAVTLDALAVELARDDPLILRKRDVAPEPEQIWTDASLEKGIVTLGIVHTKAGKVWQCWRWSGSANTGRALPGFDQSVRLPPCLRNRTILVYEVLAILSAAKLVVFDDPRERVVHCHVDNVAAVYASVKQSSRSPWAGILGLVTARAWRTRGTFPWYSYIRSKSNCADAPTRQKLWEVFSQHFEAHLNQWSYDFAGDKDCIDSFEAIARNHDLLRDFNRASNDRRFPPPAEPARETPVDETRGSKTPGPDAKRRKEGC